MELPDLSPPRSTDWDKDGVGLLADGQVVIRERAAGDNYEIAATVETWIEALRLFRNSKWTIESLQRRVDAREPDEKLRHLIKELRQRSRDADEMAAASTGPARSLAIGQAQAYAGFVGMIDRLFDLK